MSEAKPIASLSSVLLARKGAARPAMRRPSMNGHSLNGGGGSAAVAQDDLGWNDMGYDVDPDPTAPMDYEHDTGHNPLAAAVPDVKPEVKVQQDRIAEQLNVQAEKVTALHPQASPVVQIAAVKAKTPRAAPGSKDKSAFTLRLDGERHLRLRLACAVGNKSAQQLVTAALDAFINSMPEIGVLASQLPATKRNGQG
jgi:hypothetical protein